MRIPYQGSGTPGWASEHREAPGVGLLAARGVWAIMAFSVLGLFLAAIPTRYHSLTHLAPTLRSALARVDLPLGVYAGSNIGFDALYLLTSLLIAGLILTRRPRDPMTLFVSLFLVSFAGTTSPTIAALASRYGDVEIYSTLLGALGYIGLNGLFYLFPDGRFVPRWTSIMLALAIVGQIPFSMPETSSYNPNSWPLPLLMPLLLGIFGTAIFAQIYRYLRVSGPVQRQQTKWVVYGASAAIVLMFIARSSGESDAAARQSSSLLPLIRDPLLDLGFLLIPVAIGVSILRYRLWDIDLIISRTLVYGTLTTCVIGLYILMVSGLGVIIPGGDRLHSLIATGLIAVAFQPLRLRLQRGANRLLYGERDDPYAILTRLGRRLEGTLAQDNVLPTVVETIGQALKLPYAAIALQRENESAVVAAYGAPVADPLTLPLLYRHEIVGQLLLATRAPGEAFGPADRRLLEDLARQVGMAVHAVRLATDLQRARERLVAAREEERRRLRRDLHDGLGPQLASQTLTLDAARQLMPYDPTAADALLDELREHMQSAVADVRRLVYALRPPALDDLGLVAALREIAHHYAPSGLAITVEASEPLPPLAAAVEVAAYRIAQEALTNTARHAAATFCAIQFNLDQQAGVLRLTVSDDGRGVPPDQRPGVGLTSMRERATELGGRWTMEERPGGGTRVRAELPIAEVA